jgi:hypothetical protein
MISPKVDTIKNAISGGQNIVHPYDFQIILPTGPSGRKKFMFSKDNILDMNVAVRSFTLPSRTSSKQSVYYGGPLQQFPYISTYDGEITMTLLMRRNDPLLYALHAWQSLSISPTSGTLQYQDTYTMDMQLMIRSVVKQAVGPASASSTLGKPGSPTISYDLKKVWCESIGQIQMSNESANEALLYTVVLCYKDFSTSTYDGPTEIDTAPPSIPSEFSPKPAVALSLLDIIQQSAPGPVVERTYWNNDTVFDD